MEKVVFNFLVTLLVSLNKLGNLIGCCVLVKASH